MQIQNLPFSKKALLAGAFSITACQVSAAGFQLNAQSATGLGRAFSGDAVIADNASVMSRNAAGMALFDKTAMSFGLNVLKTDISVSDASYSQQHFISPGIGYSSDSNYSNAGGTSYAPNFFLIVPVNEKIAVGLDLYTNFGTRTDFSDSFLGAEYGGLTDIKSLNLGLAASYRINHQWSLGGGVDIIYGTGELEREIKVYSQVDGSQVSTVKALDANVAGTAVGFNLGSVFELDENNRFGLSYHYSPELEAKGDVYFDSTTTKNDSLYLGLPDMAEFSGYHRIKNTQYAVHYSVQWIGWSSFDTLESDAHGTISEYEWKNAFHFSLGGTYYLNDIWTLRAGYLFDQSAQDEVTSISVPDSDRHWFSTGFTYHLSEKSNIDFGFTYLLGRDVEVSEETVNGITLSSITGTTRADAMLAAVQYSHEF